MPWNLWFSKNLQIVLEAWDLPIHWIEDARWIDALKYIRFKSEMIWKVMLPWGLNLSIEIQPGIKATRGCLFEQDDKKIWPISRPEHAQHKINFQCDTILCKTCNDKIIRMNYLRRAEKYWPEIGSHRRSDFRQAADRVMFANNQDRES